MKKIPVFYFAIKKRNKKMAGKRRFELPRELSPPYSLSRTASSTTWVLTQCKIKLYMKNISGGIFHQIY